MGAVLESANELQGDVHGPGGGVLDRQIAVFDGTTGKKLTNSGITIDGGDNVHLVANTYIGRGAAASRIKFDESDGSIEYHAVGGGANKLATGNTIVGGHNKGYSLFVEASAAAISYITAGSADLGIQQDLHFRVRNNFGTAFDALTLNDALIESKVFHQFTGEAFCPNGAAIYFEAAGDVADTEFIWSGLHGYIYHEADIAHRFNSGEVIFGSRSTWVDSATIPPMNVTERSAAPSSPSAGDIYLDDGTNTASSNPGWRRYTGAVWEDISAGGGGACEFDDGGEARGKDRTLGNTDNYDLGFLTNNTNRLHIQNDGKIGFGTGNVALPLIADQWGSYWFKGTNASEHGPHMNWVTDADNYPAFFLMPYGHDNISMAWDAYFGAAVDIWQSSDAGSNFSLIKAGDLLTLYYDSGVAQGSQVTWNTALYVNSNGEMTYSPTASRKLYWRDSGIYAWSPSDGQWEVVCDGAMTLNPGTSCAVEGNLVVDNGNETIFQVEGNNLSYMQLTDGNGTGLLAAHSGQYDQAMLGVNSTKSGMQLILMNASYLYQDFDHAAQTNPTFFVHSATPPDTANDEWWSITHDVTNAVYNVGSGKHTFTGGDVELTGDIAVQSGIGTFGVQGSTRGQISILGNLLTWGAVLTMYNAEGEDTTADFYRFEANDHLDLSFGSTVSQQLRNDGHWMTVSTYRHEYRDEAIYCWSPSDGDFEIVADGTITINPGSSATIDGNLIVDGGTGNGILQVDGGTSDKQQILLTQEAASGVRIVFDSQDDQAMFLVGANSGNQLILGSYSHSAKDFDHASQTNPTLFVHSATDPDVANDEWISFAHDGTDGVIDTGTGYALFKTDIFLDTTERVYFRATTQAINSNGVGRLDLNAATAIDMNAATVFVVSASMQATAPIYYRDTGLYWYSPADAEIECVSDGLITLNAVTATVVESDLRIPSDADSFLLGAGLDVSHKYDGTDYLINSGSVNPSDIVIDCGTDKTIELTEPVFEDIQFPISTGLAIGGTTPTWAALTTNVYAYKFSVNDGIEAEFQELNHKWKEGGTGHFHLHLAIDVAQSTGSNRYAKFNVYVAFPNSGTSIFGETTLTAELTIPTGSSAKQAFYLDIGDITFTGQTIGTQVGVTVERIAATGGTEYAGDVFVTQCGCHIEQIRIGSRTEAAA
jgi:hypothetical protein